MRPRYNRPVPSISHLDRAGTTIGPLMDLTLRGSDSQQPSLWRQGIQPIMSITATINAAGIVIHMASDTSTCIEESLSAQLEGMLVEARHIARCQQNHRVRDAAPFVEPNLPIPSLTKCPWTPYLHDEQHIRMGPLSIQALSRWMLLPTRLQLPFYLTPCSIIGHLQDTHLQSNAMDTACSMIAWLVFSK